MERGILLFFSVCVVVGVLLALTRLPLDFENIRVQQAIIAGTVVSLGWLMTFVFREGSELIERTQRGRDLQKALRAEIEDYFEALDDGNNDETINSLRARFELAKTDTAAFPFFPLVSEPVIFNTLSKDVHILPEMVINNTIRFYSMLTDVRLFAEDFRTDNFERLSAERKLLAFEDYIEMRASCCLFAYEAMEKLDTSLNEVVTDADLSAEKMRQAERAAAVKSWINNPVADLGGPV